MQARNVEKARDFLARKRVAMAGISRAERDFSRTVYRELRRRGYDVIPVNPAGGEVEGRPCLAHVHEIRPPPDWVLAFTPAERTAEVVRDCAEAGVRRVWMHRGAGPGAASPEAVALCRANGIEVVTDLCPFMAFPDAGFAHRVHGFFRGLGHARRAA